MPLPSIPRQSLVTQVIGALRQKVAEGTWRVGEQIPTEQDLADQLNVGRNTVREAVRVLSHSQMLEVRQGDGTFVRRQVDPAETMERLASASLRDYLELQSVLESEAARLAASRRTEADVKKLKQALSKRGKYVAGESIADFLQRDRDFHVAVAEASHNAALFELYRFFALSLVAHEDAIAHDAHPFEPDFDSHRKIIDAIIKRDEKTAAQAGHAVLRPRIKRLSEQGGKSKV